MTGYQKVIARFLGRHVSQLVINLFIDILPFTKLLNRDYVPRAARCFLYAGMEKVWKTPQATKILLTKTSIRLSFRITVQDYRHTSKATNRKHVQGTTADLDEDVDNIHDLASAHSTTTADSVYSIDASILRSLTFCTLQSFRTISYRWHYF